MINCDKSSLCLLEKWRQIAFEKHVAEKNALFKEEIIMNQRQSFESSKLKLLNLSKEYQTSHTISVGRERY